MSLPHLFSTPRSEHTLPPEVVEFHEKQQPVFAPSSCWECGNPFGEMAACTCRGTAVVIPVADHFGDLPVMTTRPNEPSAAVLFGTGSQPRIDL